LFSHASGIYTGQIKNEPFSGVLRPFFEWVMYLIKLIIKVSLVCPE